MDNTQDTISSQPDIDAQKVEQGKPGPEGSTRRETSPTSTAAIGKTRNLSRNAAPPTSGADDTSSFKPGILLLEGNIELPGAVSVEPWRKNDTVVIPNAGRMLPLRRQTGESTDRRVAYRRWLETRSRDDLIELILSLEDHVPGSEVTDRMTKAQMCEPSSVPSEGYKIPDDMAYIRLPVLRKTPLNEPTPAWRIVLVCLDQNIMPIGLHIDSEITVGRTGGETTPDLDLTPFGAKNKGVSRIHARFRPSVNKLVLVDSDSSNGTYWNRLRIPAQTEQPLKEGDVIAFGRANFLVKIVKAPDAREPKTLL